MNSSESIHQSYHFQGVINRWAGHILVVGMLICLAGVVNGVFTRLMPFWNPNFLTVFAGLLAVEAMLSEYRTRRSIDLDLSLGSYLFVEWVTILLALRIASYLGMGMTGLQSSLQQLGLAFSEGRFFDQLFDTTFLFSLLPVISIWGLSRSYAGDLRSLQGEEVLIAIDDGAIISNRGAIRQQIANRYLVTGIILVILLGIINMDLRPEWLLSSLPSSGSMVGGGWLVAYFVQGLLLLSLAHQSALRASWAWERIPIDNRISLRWIGLSVLLVIIVGLVALALPAKYTFGLTDTLNYLIGWLITIIYAIFFFALYPLFVALVQFLRLVGFRNVENMPDLQAPLPPPPPAFEQQPVPDWLALLKSVLFWSLLIGIVLYALIMYIRQNQKLMAVFRRVPGWRLILQAVRWLRDQLQGAGRTVGGLVTAGRQRIEEFLRRARGASARVPALRLGRMDARQQVRFYYLAMLRRSSESGHPRHADETPAEYAASLSAVLAGHSEGPQASLTQAQTESEQVEKEIVAMTDAFIEARYTKHTIDHDRVHLVRQAWSHLRRFLRDRSRSEE